MITLLLFDAAIKEIDDPAFNIVFDVTVVVDLVSVAAVQEHCDIMTGSCQLVCGLIDSAAVLTDRILIATH